MWTLLKVSWRSLWRNTRRTIITLSAIGFAVSLAVFFVAFANGVYASMINEAVRMNAGHVTLQNPEYLDAPAVDLTVPSVAAWRTRIEKLPDVETTKLLVLGQGVAQSGYGAVGAAIMGIEPEREAKTSPLARQIRTGRYLEKGDDRLAVVGTGLARRLKLELDSKMVVTSNDVNGEIVDQMVRIAGIFETGAEEIDGYVVQVPIAFARRLYGIGPDAATELGVVLKNPDDQNDMLQTLRAMVGDAPVAVLPWEKVLPDLAAYIRVDGGSNWVMQAILIFLSLFTIFNTILMSVLERTREFAVLMAIGTHPRRLKMQVVVESALLGLLGTGIGLLVGGLAGYWLQVHGFDLASFYPNGITVSGLALNSRIHALVTPGLLVGLGLTMLTATTLAGMVTVRRLGRINIASVLR